MFGCDRCGRIAGTKAAREELARVEVRDPEWRWKNEMARRAGVTYDVVKEVYYLCPRCLRDLMGWVFERRNRDD